jgi:hypothetical protein
MEDLAANPSELRTRGFKALVDGLGWANAVRFMRQFEGGVGDYTKDRDGILPGWDAETLVRQAEEIARSRVR